MFTARWLFWSMGLVGAASTFLIAQEVPDRRPDADEQKPPARERLFNSLDADGDGRISRQEFDRQADELRTQIRERRQEWGEMTDRLRDMIRDEVQQALRGRGGPFGMRGQGFGPPPGARRQPGRGGPRDGAGRGPRDGAGRGRGYGLGPCGAHVGFGRLDANQDGKLQPEEVQKLINALTDLKSAATQGDVTIDAWRKLMQEQMGDCPLPPQQRGRGFRTE